MEKQMSLRNRALVFGILTVFCSSAVLADQNLTWNQWRGPNRDCQIDGAEFPEQLNGKLNLVWERSHSESYSGPIVSGDLVFTTETLGKKDEQVTAHRLSDGEVAWTSKWKGSMAVPFFAASNGDWIRSTPACDGDHLIVMSMIDILVCLDPKTGDEKWRVDFPKKMKTPLPSFGAVCSPLIHGKAVYVQTGGALVKLNVDTGEEIWTSLKNGAGMMSSGAFSSPVIATLGSVEQLVVATRQALVGVDLKDGKTLWSEPIQSFRGMNILTPVVIGDTVFTSAHSGRAQMFDVANNAGTWSVTEKWNQKSQGYMSSPVVVGKTIYMHMKNQRVSALAVENGDIQWTSKTFGKYWSMVSNGKQILALDNGGDLLLIQPSSEELEIVDKMKVANDAWAHLAVQGKYIIVRDLRSLKVYSW